MELVNKNWTNNLCGISNEEAAEHLAAIRKLRSLPWISFASPRNRRGELSLSHICHYFPILREVFGNASNDKPWQYHLGLSSQSPT